MKQFELIEYQTSRIPAADLSLADGEQLWQQYGPQIEVEFPSPKTNNHWQLTPQGWVGYIPLTAEVSFSLRPKVPIHNLFVMLAYAYDLRSFRFLDGLTNIETLSGFYDRLAAVLAERVLLRSRQGLYRAYQPQQDHLQVVRGRLQFNQLMQRPEQVSLPCDYEEHTADMVHNQILAVTLRLIGRSGLAREDTQQLIRRAYHTLPLVQEPPLTAADLDGLLYDRLNDDYRILHALCRFFLDYSSPIYTQGDYETLPFLVNMNQLFEKFVASWLQTHLPPPYTVKIQEDLTVGKTGQLRVNPDLVIYEAAERPLMVLDTKYKIPDTPAADDVYQVAFYASNGLGCQQAILVYPQRLARPLNDRYQNVSVRSLPFALQGDLEIAGQQFLNMLFHPTS